MNTDENPQALPSTSSDAADSLLVTAEESSPEAVTPTLEAPSAQEMPKAGTPRFPIVGIGASAGGLKALEQFFTYMPAQSGMAFVVITHMSANQRSELPEILQNYTFMEVSQVEQATKVSPDKVYVIPPGKSLTIAEGVLQPQELPLQTERQLLIDHFLQSLAHDQGEYAVGVILSGTGADGVHGLKALKEQAGITLVQTPEDAEFDGMPRSALAAGVVDFVLPATELATKLFEIKQVAAEISLLKATDRLPETEAETLQKIFALVRARTSHDFIHYKRSTVLRRIARRMQVNGVKSLVGYLSFLRGHPVEIDALFKDLLISVTSFFRDREAFDALIEEVIPRLFERKTGDEKVRVWVAGCATGEEAYSLAMLLIDYATQHNIATPIQIFASDIDVDALQVAREGLYAESLVGDVPAEWLKRFFVHDRQGYRVTKDVRKMVLFTAHDLLKDPPFSKLDLITCRNVLIYFNRAVQERCFQLFYYALREDGHLFLGSSESLETSKSLFSILDQKYRFFRRRPLSNPTLWLSALSPDLKRKELVNPSETASRRLPTFTDVHQRLLAKEYGPPSVIVNENYEVMHVSGGAGRYLQFGEGEPTRNILDMMPPDLRLELRTALYQILHKSIPEQNKRKRRLKIEINGQVTLIDLIVQPIPEEELGAGFVQVIFEEPEITEAAQPLETASLTPDQNFVLLEAELRYTKEQLQTVMEQYEASTEELQASNEELLAMNEELQSTTEELETGREELQSMNEELEASKEELQSTNEELLTVNDELSTKLDELSHANNDLKNLIASTDIALLFLDNVLRIKRYTPRITELFNIIPSDLERPLAHVTGKLVYVDFARDIDQVLRTQTRLRHEIHTADNHWYIMQITPYRTMDERIEGVVITFVEVTDLRATQAKLEALNQALEARVKERTDQVRSLSSSLTVAEQWERRRISQVLHDNLQQLLYGLQMRIQLLAQELAQSGQPQITTEINEVNTLLSEAIHSTRSLSVELNPPVLQGEGLPEALQWLAHHMQQTYGLTVTVKIQENVQNSEHTLAFSKRMLLVQLVRELLFNVVKHANVKQAEVNVYQQDEQLCIEIKDQGVGFKVEAFQQAGARDGHFGMFSMQERLALFGGRLEMASDPQAGTRMTIIAPLLAEDVPTSPVDPLMK
ncbi:MAG: PAS domain-containing protein [Chloroflexi bacterium]|nr:PAS domain-containing protein [Chloroflexota bacterium]